MQENNFVINVLLVIIMILVVAVCFVLYMCFTNGVEIIELQQEETLFSEENYPRIDGSQDTLLLAEAFKANFTKTDVKEVDIQHSNTHNAYINLINGNTDLILVTYPSKTEKEMAKSKGVEFEIVPIAKEAFVFFVNKKNIVKNLTLNQIQNIYSGKIKNWKDVGGSESEIVAFQKTENSNNQNGMLELVMQGTKMIEPITETISKRTSDIIDVISDYDNRLNAIGYSYYYYATTMYTNDEMKLLSIDGIQPTYDNIQTGLYDLQTTYYAVIRKDEPEDSNTRILLNAMKSKKGQIIAKEAGYVQNY